MVKDFLQYVWKWIQGQRKGCRRMMGHKDSQMVGYHRKRSSLDVSTLPTTSCGGTARHCRKHPSACFLTKKLEKSYAIILCWERILGNYKSIASLLLYTS